MVATAAAELAPWTARRRFWFRTGLGLFLLQVVVSALDASPAARALGDSMQQWARTVGAAISPPLVEAVERIAARGDGHVVGLSLLRDGLLALAVAGIWSAIDRRPQHERGARRLRLVLRYLVGTVMLVYGSLKVVPVQFQVPPAEQILMPLGDHSPMSLLWATIGISPAYTIFGGLGEYVGGMLLLWRRTTTLGALLVTAVMTNVVMLNFCYDVPVKRGAALLLLSAMVLAAHDRRAMWAILWHRQAGSPEPEAPFDGGPLARRLRAVVKSIWVGAGLAAPVAIAIMLGLQPAAGPLHGVHRVEADTAATASASGWQLLWIGTRGGAVVQTADGHCRRYDFTVDVATQTLALRQQNGAPLRFSWAQDAARLRLQDLDLAGRTIELRSMPAAEAFRLLR
ncbi:MAG: hypothetical protein IPK26_29665 [Planctomycetes bacterium]|nr:hypothetical protein [Planctomycetota bacterium]